MIVIFTHTWGRYFDFHAAVDGVVMFSFYVTVVVRCGNVVHQNIKIITLVSANIFLSISATPYSQRKTAILVRIPRCLNPTLSRAFWLYYLVRQTTKSVGCMTIEHKIIMHSFVRQSYNVLSFVCATGIKNYSWSSYITPIISTCVYMWYVQFFS